MKNKLLNLKNQIVLVVKLLRNNDTCDNEWLQQEISDLISSCQSLENCKFESLQEENVFCSFYAVALQLASIIIIDFKNSFNEFKDIEECTSQEKEKINKGISLLEKSLYYCKKAETLSKFLGEEGKGPTSALANICQNIKKTACSQLGTLYTLCEIDFNKGYQYYEEAANQNSVPSAIMMIYFFLRPENFDIDVIEKYFEILYSKLNINSFYSMFEFKNIVSKIIDAYCEQGLYFEAVEVINNFEIQVKYSLLSEEKKLLLGDFNNTKKACLEKINDMKKEFESPRFLATHFKEDILNLMSEEVKIFLSTALEIKEMMLEHLKMPTYAMDFSSVIIPTAKAIETIVFKLLGEKFLQFLRSLPHVNIANVDNLYKIYDKQNNQVLKFFIKKLTLGSAVEIIVNKEDYYNGIIEYKPNEYFLKFCKEVGVENAEEYILELHKDLKFIHTWRNNSAHKNRVFQSSAEKCLERSLKCINLLYQNFGNLLCD